MIIVKKLYADGSVEDVGEKWTLAEMQAFVGGYVEQIPSSIPSHYLLANEDGLRLNLPQNSAATALVRADVLRAGPIRGNALLFK